MKFDSYRTQIIVQNDTARVYTRNGLEWSQKFWPIGLAAQALPCKWAIIDGEVIAPGENGVSDFAAAARAIRSEPSALSFVAFDLLHLDGKDLRGKTLLDRRRQLAELVNGNPKIHFSESFEGDAAAIFRAVEAMGLEGMVSKRADSRYRSGPSKAWLRARCFVESDFELLRVAREPGQAAQRWWRRLTENMSAARSSRSGARCERLWERVQAKPGPAPKGIKKAGAQ